MNKFLNRRIIPSAIEKDGYYMEGNSQAMDFLNQCASYWNSLDEVRRKLRRSLMYSYGDQWGDYVRDPDSGNYITEGELIKKNGKVPLKNNMIAPILSNIDGQLRQNTTRPHCVARDQSEAKIGEMMSMAIEYVHDLNEVEEIDSDSMRLLLNGGFIAQRIEYGLNAQKNKRDVWIYGVSPSRLFFNTNIEDVRMWDITCIGELYDMTIDEVLSHFAHSNEEREWILSLYPDNGASLIGDSSLRGDETKDVSFYTASRSGLCRVILGWNLESREAYRWDDKLKGTWGYVPLTPENKQQFDAENQRRLSDAKKRRIAKEDILLIDYSFSIERYWYYRYMTPWGNVLKEGRSPYWHGEHNYVLFLYPMIHCRLGNFVEQFIDQQRAINRTATLIDFIRGTSSKGVLVVDDEAFENMSREEVVDEYVRYNGVLFVKLKPGQSIDGVVRQYNSGTPISGDFELLNLQLKLINEISGVNSAMQGHPAKSGTPASLYALQTQNSSLNLRGLFDSFKSFRKRRDIKVMKTIQQFYNEDKHIDIAGKDYKDESRWYNATKVKHAEIDLTIGDGYNTPVYQMLANDFLMEMFRTGAVDIKTMLENSSYPFAGKILESIKSNQQQLQNGQQMEGIPPEILAQLQQSGGEVAQQQEGEQKLI